jgi:hypothetical protein
MTEGRERKKALLYTLNRSYWCRQMSAIPGRESREELEVTFSLRFEEVVCSDAGIEEGRAGLGLGTQQRATTKTTPQHNRIVKVRTADSFFVLQCKRYYHCSAQ